ncbi:(2,3-dihydroxybenzoyl)adenylate synthase [Heyndrickxia ginsengihumi]|uniref:(2,3-dihydroxybenzoyl)adenylate synthase n=1 Tax=Heyndrickxia ginsengihumi TaxID=363870 RepID=UPI00046E94A3|nr:(2,3-dihydroxybenzoyl)adenylate synthase [Heyndrickxia ginsengihumi]
MLDGCTPWPEDFAKFYRKEGCWQGETFGEMLSERGKTFGNRIAITCQNQHISYQELDRKVDQLAAGFCRLGIGKNDRVIVQLPNKIEFFESIFALFRIGAIPVFALPSHRYNEIHYFSEFCNAKAYIIPDEYMGFDYRVLARKVQQSILNLKHIIVVGDSEEFLELSNLYMDPMVYPKIQSDDIAFLQLSGGSTGISKLIPRTHDDYIYSLRKSVEICRLNSDSVYLAVLPIAHNYPLSSPGVLGTLYAGGKIVLSASPSPDEAFPLIEKERVTITAVVPPLAHIWLDAVSTRSFDLSSLQVLQVGGSKFSSEAARRVKPIFGCKLQQVFGMAEGLVNYTRLDDPEEIIVNTQGKPMSEYDEILIVDEEDNELKHGQVGELLTRGPYTIRGYYKADHHNARAFTDDGFYRTGDLAKMNDSGYLIVEGRAKDQINRGGEKVSAEEIENHLFAHPSVLDVAVISIPDKFLGEAICACMISRKRSIEITAIRDFLKERGLATYKIPDRIEFVNDFPKTPVGKINKRALREIITNQLYVENS